MAEGEGNTSLVGQDIASDKKVEQINMEKKVEELQKTLKEGQIGIIPLGLDSENPEQLTVENYKGQLVLKLRGIDFCIVKPKDGQLEFNYNINNYSALADTEIDFKSLGMPDLQHVIDQEEKRKRENDKNGPEQNPGEEQEEEKGNMLPEQETDSVNETDDETTKRIAKQYAQNANPNQIVHLSKNKKITQQYKLGNLVEWADRYDEIFIVPGEDEFTRRVIGIKDGKEEEIKEAEKSVRGKNPNVRIKRFEGDTITEMETTPLQMYKIDETTSIAIIRGKSNMIEAVYCRESPKEKTVYLGIVVPEDSVKNVYQQDTDARKMMNDGLYTDYKIDDVMDEIDLEERIEKRSTARESWSSRQ